MPCTFTGSLQGDHLLLTKEALDKMTDKLCRTCQKAEDGGWLDQLDDDVKKWWKKHKREDAKRG
jgi:hypothetical protein